MADRPILYSAPMVRALREDRKSQTRRLLDMACDEPPAYVLDGEITTENEIGRPYRWPRTHAVGDRLWVREAHVIYDTHGQHRSDGSRWGPWGGLPTMISPDGTKIAYFREGFDRSDPGRWRPSIHMPRWASRLTQIVTDVRVQRLKEIDEADAMAEGIYPAAVYGEQVASWLPAEDQRDRFYRTARDAYGSLWDRINGRGAWDKNPWVAAYTFTVRHCNIDVMEASND